MTNISENIKDIDNQLYYDFNSLCLMIGEDNVPYQFRLISDEYKLVHNKVKYVSESQTYLLIIRSNLDTLYREVFEAFRSFGYPKSTAIPVQCEEIKVNSELDESIKDLTKLHESILKKSDRHVENLLIFIESNV